MPKFSIFLDSSALIAGAISELIILESERSMARKSPGNLDDFRQLIKSSNLRIVPNPTRKEVEANFYLIKDPTDVPILIAAMKANVDYLATHNHRHSLDDPKVAELSGLRIGTPGDVLAWLRDNL